MDGKIADRKGYEYVRKLVSAASNGLSGGQQTASEAKGSSGIASAGVAGAAGNEGPQGAAPAKMTTEVRLC